MLTITVPDNCKVEISRGLGGSWIAGIDQNVPDLPFEDELMLIDEEPEAEEDLVMCIDESYSMCIDESYSTTRIV